MIWTFLDIESTGLIDTPFTHRMWEFAASIYDMRTRTKVGSYARRWNPGRPMDAKAFAAHGVHESELAHLPKLEEDTEAVDMIHMIYAKSTALWAHNGIGFDIPFLDLEFARIGRPLPTRPVVDTMVQARWATPMGKSPNLGDLAFACRVPYDKLQAHAAEYDTDILAACAFHGYDRGFFKLPETATS